MARTLVVSNRLPITVQRTDHGFLLERSSGGLATGMKSVHSQGSSRWIGWPGFPGELLSADGADLAAQYEALRVVPVMLSRQELAGYYEGYCNAVLWPLFHSFPSQLPLEGGDFDIYRRVNQRFADATIAQWREGDVVWVHDYQLMLVPGMIRARLPKATIGFFLHIPFPPAETFRILPSRAPVLEGLLGSDLIGFHTAAYMRNFAGAVLHVLGAGMDVNTIAWGGGSTQVGVFPMGVDAAAYQSLAESAEVAALVESFRPGPERLLVGIDRLDYTKGIPRRLLAYERLLEDHPELHGQVRLVQVSVPSRTEVDAYAGFRAQVDGMVGRINGRFGTPSWAPLHYVYRNFSDKEVVALYRAADTLLVTPIRDGMNLVAKEFVAARSDGGGVLVLSEFAGAAAELGEAVRVNPYDISGMAKAIYGALTMEETERAARMTALRSRVLEYDVHRWAQSYIRALEDAGARAQRRSLAYSSEAEVEAAVAAMRDAPTLVLLLDYDGTLVKIVDAPALAVPDSRLLALLERLANRPRTQVHVVSGRGQDVLEEWLGHLSIWLHAEHGFSSRAADGTWSSQEIPPGTWRPKALKILEDFAARTPGSLVEHKHTGLAWHYRMADPEYGPFQANELKVHLSSVLSNAPVEVLIGDKVVELRPHGSNKGRIVQQVLGESPAGAFFAAFGDDRTDEDLFAALPAAALSFHVGASASAARLRLPSFREVRAVLARLPAEPSR